MRPSAFSRENLSKKRGWSIKILNKSKRPSDTADMNILILEDDQAIQKKLTDILKQPGLNICTAPTANSAQFLCSTHSFDLMIVDFLLPDSMNGVEFINQLPAHHKQCALWFISSIFKEENISKELKDTKIDLFLKKPLNTSLIKKEFEKLKTQKLKNKDGIFFTLYKENISSEDLTQLIKDQPSLKNSELAVLYSLFPTSNFTGCIHLCHKEYTSPCALSFSKGNLTSVQTPHKKSYFGVLLYEHGFSDIEDIKKHLLDKTTKGKIGEKLVQSGCVSPHAIHKILKEQSKIRLSQLLSGPSPVTISIQPETSSSRNSTYDYSLDLQELRHILAETLWAKVDLHWLENFLSLKENNIPLKTKDQNFSHSQTPWMEQCQKITSLIDGKKSLGEISSSAQQKFSFEKREILFSLYYLMIGKYIILQETNVKPDNAKRIAYIQKRIEIDDYFQFLNLSQNTNDEIIKERIQQMIQTFHPDSIHKPTPQILKNLNEIISHLNTIKAALLDPEKKQAYLAHLGKNSKKEHMEINQLYCQAKSLLEKRKYHEALSLLEKIKNKKEIPEDTPLYYCWAFMKTRDSFNYLKEENDHIFSLMDRLSLEMKHSYLYHFVQALYFIKLKDFDMAKSKFKICLSINPRFFIAQLEWDAIKKKNQSALSRFFKKSG